MDLPPEIKKHIDTLGDVSGLKVEYADGFEKSLKRMFSHNPIYAVPRWFGDMKDRIEAAWQRVFKGWDYSSVWSFHHVHSEETRDKLRHLAARHHGCPGGLCHKPGYHFYGDASFIDTEDNKEKKKLAGDKCEWEEKLKEIADGFQAAIDLDNMLYMEGTKDKAVWDIRRAALEGKFEHGMDLFKKYYFNLWD